MSQKTLTPEQVNEWAPIAKAMFEARKWSDESLSPEEVKEKSDRFKAYQKEKSSTDIGRKLMQDTLIEIWRSLEPENDKTLGWEEMRLMPEKMAEDQDR